MDIVESLFVERAPFVDERRLIFQAFKTWVALFRTVSPSAVLWIDGGFVTHKSTPPKDIDVVGFVPRREAEAWNVAQQRTLETLLTFPGNSERPRLQPMGGLVDGFFAVRGEIDRAATWHETWSAVYVNGQRAMGAYKGYLEVRLS